MPDTQIDPTLSNYAETLIRDKNYTSLTSEMYEEMKKDILKRLHDFMIAKTIAKLSEEDVKGLKALLDKNATDEEIQNFVASKIEDAPAFLGDVLFQFRQTFLGLV